jgi:phosphate transport system substrate-binding protein
VTASPTQATTGTVEISPELRTAAGNVRLDGSTANIPLAISLLQTTLGISKEDAEERVSFSTTPQAYINIIVQWEGDSTTADLLLVYEADEGTKQIITDSRTQLEYHEIGLDALVFIVNAQNPITSLTSQQIQDIYTGKVTNWNQVGGDDVPIAAYQRPEASGSQALMRKLCMAGLEMAEAPQILIPGSMGGLMDAVGAYDNGAGAIGYSVFYYADTMYANENIKIIKVNDVEPSNETIGNGAYPYVNPFFAVVRADEPQGSDARIVLDFILSDAGKRLIEQAGYVTKQ